MKQAVQIINNIELRQFAPFGKLSRDDAQELLRTSIIVTLSPGTPLFSDGNSDNQLFYLIEGKVEFCSANKKTIIDSNTDGARNPISRQTDKQATAVAIKQSTLISFDADMLDLFLNWTNPDAYIVSEIDSAKNHEWLSPLLKSRGLLRFSEQQINTLLERMNEVHFNKGDIVISQDDDDEFYYVIKNGRATVTRKPTPHAKDIKLAELSEGDAFGEEAILSQTNRSATITMSESGDLMRLSKKDFSELLAQPLLETISWDEAQAIIATGAEFIDIRQEEDFNNLHIPNSSNIPLPLLRLKLNKLKQHRKYIICCEDGSLSPVAAFLLNRNGFDAFILDGGMTTVTSQMADYAMGKFATEPDTTKQPPTSDITSENYNSSLAEHWGNMVKEPRHDGFDDTKALHRIEKTSVAGAIKQHISTPSYTLPKQTIPAIKHSIQKNNSNNTLFRNILLGVIAIFIAAAISIYFSSPNKATTNKKSETTASTSVEKATAPAIPTYETIETTTSTSRAITAVTPMTRFVTPKIEDATTEKITTEPMVNNEVQLTNIEIIKPQTSSKNPDTTAIAIDPATRGFIE